MGTVISLYFRSYDLAQKYVQKQMSKSIRYEGVYPSRMSGGDWFAGYRVAHPLLPEQVQILAEEASNYSCIAFYVSEAF